MVFTGLIIILLIVLFLPFLIKKIEEELEIFLFVMGCLAVTATAQWHVGLIKDALYAPAKITAAVFLAGLLFKWFQAPLAYHVNQAAVRLGIKRFVFLVVILLGFLSSVITAIIAALILVEIAAHLKLDRKNEIIFVVLACFSIGFGAVLTPVGEPLSTIITAKLQGAPYHAGFLFLFHHFKFFIITAVVLFGLLAALIVSDKNGNDCNLEIAHRENFKDVLMRTVKVSFFIIALVLLGQGFKPLVDACIAKISWQGLYWINIISAVVDNATLAAAEISPAMSLLQIKSAALGLVIAGGILIPGNIPNIIAASRLKIKSSEWARYGLPLGLAMMAIFFFALIMVQKSQ
jgi:predicted cation transporter